MANLAAVPIAGEILIGQHRGSEDSTSKCFIRVVLPTWVVFSAGPEYHHPRQSTADRLTAIGIDLHKILRTDR